MGWTYFRKAPEATALETIRKEIGEENWNKHIVASRVTGGAVFLVHKEIDPNSDVYIPDADGSVRSLVLFRYKNTPKAIDGMTFGYRDETETMGPYRADAPASVIALCSALRPMTDADKAKRFSMLKSATDYRARCLAAAKLKETKRKLQPGCVVKLPEPVTFSNHLSVDTFTTALNEKGKIVFVANGVRYRLPPQYLAGATISVLPRKA